MHMIAPAPKRVGHFFLFKNRIFSKSEFMAPEMEFSMKTVRDQSQTAAQRVVWLQPLADELKSELSTTATTFFPLRKSPKFELLRSKEAPPTFFFLRAQIFCISTGGIAIEIITLVTLITLQSHVPNLVCVNHERWESS